METTPPDGNGGTDVEEFAALDHATDPKPSALMRGKVRQLRCLSAGTDIPSTHLISAHNYAGYGCITAPAGDVFFDASAITNRRFDQLTPGMTVEFTLDQASYLRTSRITVVGEESGLQPR
jgi:cold shock CspA family protein